MMMGLKSEISHVVLSRSQLYIMTVFMNENNRLFILFTL